jgi:hypothetical protein
MAFVDALKAFAAVASAVLAVKSALLAAESAVEAVAAAEEAKSLAALTALGVAAWEVEVLFVLEFSWTTPAIAVEAFKTEITCGILPVICTGEVASSELPPAPFVA